MKKIKLIFAIAFIFIAISGANAQEKKQIVLYKNGSASYSAQVRNVDSIKFVNCPEVKTEFTIKALLSYTWNEKTYTQSGNYEQTLLRANGCDSIVTLHLTICPEVKTEFTVASPHSYIWAGTTYTESGNYEKTFPRANGCDSTVTLHLTICSGIETEFTENAPAFYTWNDSTYTQSGDYVQTFKLADGCDSTVTLHLTVTGCPTLTEEFSATSTLSYTWNGQTYTASGNYAQTFTLDNGCDSIVTLHLTITGCPVLETEKIVSAPLSYTWNGKKYTESGDYTHTFELANGCTMNVTLHLTIFDHIEINGIKWAVCNVNTPGTFAANPEDPGMFYQWGRKVGYSATDPRVSTDGSTNWPSTRAEGDTWLEANDPCPAGWRVPSVAELDDLLTTLNSISTWEFLNGIRMRFFGAGEQKLALRPAGRRTTTGSLAGNNSECNYWSNSASGNSGSYIYIGSSSSTKNSSDKMYGYSVRCVKKD